MRKGDLHVIAAESWFHNLTRIAFSKTLSFYMLWTEASMNKANVGDLMDWRKLKIWHQTCPEEMGQCCMRHTHLGFSKEHSYHWCCLMEDFPTPLLVHQNRNFYLGAYLIISQDKRFCHIMLLLSKKEDKVQW